MLYRRSADANNSRFFLPSYNPRGRNKPPPCAFAAARLFRLPLLPKVMKMPLDGVTAVSERRRQACWLSKRGSNRLARKVLSPGQCSSWAIVSAK